MYFFLVLLLALFHSSAFLLVGGDLGDANSLGCVAHLGSPLLSLFLSLSLSPLCSFLSLLFVLCILPWCAGTAPAVSCSSRSGGGAARTVVRYPEGVPFVVLAMGVGEVARVRTPWARGAGLLSDRSRPETAQGQSGSVIGASC